VAAPRAADVHATAEQRASSAAAAEEDGLGSSSAQSDAGEGADEGLTEDQRLDVLEVLLDTVFHGRYQGACRVPILLTWGLYQVAANLSNHTRVVAGERPAPTCAAS